MATSVRATKRFYRTAQPSLYGPIADLLGRAGDEPELLRAVQRQIAEWLRDESSVLAGVMLGNTNNVDTITLTASVASTTISDRRIGPDTLLVLVPTTANAAGEVATLYQTIPNATEAQAVLNHANNAQADRTFGVVYCG